MSSTTHRDGAAPKARRDGRLPDHEGSTETWRVDARWYENVLALMPAGLYVVEAGAGTIAYYNEQAARIWGREPRLGALEERFCGGYKIFTPDGTFVPRDETPMAVAIRDGRSFRNVEAIIERPDGSRITALINIDPLRDSAGRVTGAVNVFYDITDRRQMEKSLRESDARYRAVVESQSEMVCRFHPDGSILFVNGAYARSCGTTPEEMQQQSFWNFIPASDRDAVRAMLDGLTPDSPVVRIENRFTTVEGERWMLWTNRALRFDAEGRLIEAQSTGIDITDRKRAEQALRESDRRKDEFLAVLSHELRNPLAPIKNIVALLRTPGADASLLDQVLPVLERQVGHLIRLVDDLLDLARINRGDIILQKRATSLAEIVSAALETSRPLIDARSHHLEVRLANAADTVFGDPVRLAQGVANLLNNAATYTRPGGKLEVSTRSVENCAELRVRDNGFGIPSEAMETIFELFERGENTHEHPSGFGIGLALTRRLVEMHGGTIDVRSDGPDLGSEFVIRLPIERVEPKVADSAVDQDDAGTGKHILVVDDNLDAARSLALLLETIGADVSVAGDGPSALEAFGTERPAVVILDIGMPGMSGLEVAREIRKRYPSTDAVLVAHTGWGQEDDRRSAAEAGFAFHLVKPAELSALKKILAAVPAGPRN